MQDLDQAIALQTAAVAATRADHPDRGTYLHNLGIAMEGRFERTGAEEDLDKAIVVSRQAVEASSADHRDRSMYMSSLGDALLLRFERTGARRALDQAIALLFTAEIILDADDPGHAAKLSNLGVALRVGFEHTGAMELLDEAIRVGGQAVQATPTTIPAAPRSCPTSAVRLCAGSSTSGTSRIWTRQSAPSRTRCSSGVPTIPAAP